MQTRRRQQFKISWQVIVIIVLCLAALALPLGGVILMLRSLMTARVQQDSGPAISGVLQNRLEGIVDERLSWRQVPLTEPRIERIAYDIEGEKTRIAALAASFGGSSISRLESEREIRLLVQVPEKHSRDFLAACQQRENGLVSDPFGGFMEVVIRKSSSQ